MDWEETKAFFVPCFPEEISAELELLYPGELREIRVRAQRKCVFRTGSRSVTLPWRPTAREVEALAEALCEHGLYARGGETSQGYVTLRGGHRMGLCGRVLREGGSQRTLQDIASVCIRVACAWPGAADPLMPLCRTDAGVGSLLVIGPPGSGKTTILRDLARQLASGRAPLQTAVVDERGELAACVRGVPQLDVGETCDVLDGCPKEQAFPWLIRSMAPQVAVTDELGHAGEISAVMDAMSSGIAVMASVHGTGLKEAASRPALAAMMAQRAFRHYVVLAPEGGGRILAVYDRNGSPLRAGE